MSNKIETSDKVGIVFFITAFAIGIIFLFNYEKWFETSNGAPPGYKLYPNSYGGWKCLKTGRELVSDMYNELLFPTTKTKEEAITNAWNYYNSFKAQEFNEAK